MSPPQSAPACQSGRLVRAFQFLKRGLKINQGALSLLEAGGGNGVEPGSSFCGRRTRRSKKFTPKPDGTSGFGLGGTPSRLWPSLCPGFYRIQVNQESPLFLNHQGTILHLPNEETLVRTTGKSILRFSMPYQIRPVSWFRQIPCLSKTAGRLPFGSGCGRAV